MLACRFALVLLNASPVRAQLVLVGVAILKDNRRHPIGMSQRQPKPHWGAVVKNETWTLLRELIRDPKIPQPAAQREQTSKHQVERHIGGPRLDFGNTRLARFQFLG